MSERLLLFFDTVMAIVPIVTIICLLVLLGWWVATGLMSTALKQQLSLLVSRFLIPFWLFLNAVTADLSHLMTSTYTAAYFMAALLFSVVVMFFNKHQSAALVLASTYSNTLYFSLPIIALVLGSRAMNYALPIIMLNTFFVLSGYELLKHRGEQQGLHLISIHKRLINSLSNPIVLSILLGLIANMMFSKATGLLASIKLHTTIPVLSLALISLGVSLQAIPQKSLRTPWLAVMSKLVVFPLFVFCCAYYLFDLKDEIIQVVVILAASPLAINSYFFVNGNRGAEQLIGRCILLSSVLSMVSMPLWILVLKMVLFLPVAS
jgi:predicted permease